MGLIETCILGNINPFKYLASLIENEIKVAARPDKWLPWNYQEN